VAEEKSNAAEEKGAVADAPAAPAQKPTLFIALLIFNMLAIGGVGVMLFLNKKKEDQKATIDQVIEGEKQAQAEEKESDMDFIGSLVPLETFVVNLAGSRGSKLLKVNMELEISNAEVQEEIEKRKPQIRDMILIMLSTKSFNDLSEREGKDRLREEIAETINSFLSRGKIKRVYFTEFIFN